MTTWGPTALGSGTRRECTRSKPIVKSINEWASKRWFQVRRALLGLGVGVRVLPGHELKGHHLPDS